MTRTPLYFDDYRPGHVFEAGSRTVTEAEILAFARDFDPQSFHTDPVAAGTSIFGGLVASGWHTAALMMRLFADNVLCPESSLGSPGVDELRWPNPVRPGDTLTLRVTVLKARRSQSKPDRGIVTLAWQAVNQHGAPVLTLTANGLVRVRP
jgi:acyl dehydratase